MGGGYLELKRPALVPGFKCSSQGHFAFPESSAQQSSAFLVVHFISLSTQRHMFSRFLGWDYRLWKAHLFSGIHEELKE